MMTRAVGGSQQSWLILNDSSLSYIVFRVFVISLTDTRFWLLRDIHVYLMSRKVCQYFDTFTCFRRKSFPFYLSFRVKTAFSCNVHPTTLDIRFEFIGYLDIRLSFRHCWRVGALFFPAEVCLVISLSLKALSSEAWITWTSCDIGSIWGRNKKWSWRSQNKTQYSSQSVVKETDRYACTSHCTSLRFRRRRAYPKLS